VFCYRKSSVEPGENTDVILDGMKSVGAETHVEHSGGRWGNHEFVTFVSDHPVEARSSHENKFNAVRERVAQPDDRAQSAVAPACMSEELITPAAAEAEGKDRSRTECPRAACVFGDLKSI
jgi:hypothetical protein